jgi:hypothetical protein
MGPICQVSTRVILVPFFPPVMACYALLEIVCRKRCVARLDDANGAPLRECMAFFGAFYIYRSPDLEVLTG